MNQQNDTRMKFGGPLYAKTRFISILLLTTQTSLSRLQASLSQFNNIVQSHQEIYIEKNRLYGCAFVSLRPKKGTKPRVYRTGDLEYWQLSARCFNPRNATKR